MAIAGGIPMRQQQQQHEEEEEAEEEKDSHEHDLVMPGFRFHPTEEELIEFYLRRKVEGKRFNVELITFLDLYRYDPWELPALAAIGEKEWYFYVPRDRKYRNGDRPNRVTTSGYWKATGADRMIRTDNLRSIGLKKTLVFYSGKAPKGIRSSWIMNEYRLPHHDTHRYQKAEISLCRVYKRAGVDDHHSSSSSINPRPHHHHHQYSSKPIITQSSSSSAAAAAAGRGRHSSKQAQPPVDYTTSTSTTGSFQSIDCRQSPPIHDLLQLEQPDQTTTDHDGIHDTSATGGIASIITTLGLTVTAPDFTHKAPATTPTILAEQQQQQQQHDDGTLLLQLHQYHQQHPHCSNKHQYSPSSLFVDPDACSSTNFFMTSNTTTTSSSSMMNGTAISTVDELRRVVDYQQQFYAHHQQQQQQQQQQQLLLPQQHHENHHLTQFLQLMPPQVVLPNAATATATALHNSLQPSLISDKLYWEWNPIPDPGQ
ncbi:hypothetical protein Syun_002823 [Stephania yunnanensis]|uniref:NAC domain-containing protein n=1 Tax=Stephania yunnanensis TaxID=152371 RepID=A0AAP0Q385_9MAGN